MVRGPRKKRLDFGGNPGLDPDPEMFQGILPLRHCIMLKAPHHGFGSSPKKRRLADLKLNELKAGLAENCHPRMLLF